MPSQRATEIAARFGDLVLRTEAAHQEAFVRQGSAARVGPAESETAIASLVAWASGEHRQPSGSIRQVFVHNPDNGAAGPDSEFAIPCAERPAVFLLPTR